MLSTVAAEKNICYTAAALLNLSEVAVRFVLSIDAVEKDKSALHRECSQMKNPRNFGLKEKEKDF